MPLQQEWHRAHAEALLLLSKPQALTRAGEGAHTEWMNYCVPTLMGYGKDQDVAVAACLNMWRDTWEATHPEGAVDPGPPRPEKLARWRAQIEKFWDESEHPRDEDGKFTDKPGSAGSTGREDDNASLLLVTERPKQEKIDEWVKQIETRSEELAKEGQAGNNEDNQLSGMQTALNNYMQEPDAALDREEAGLNAVYDGNNKLRGAAYTYIDANRVAIIRNFGALDHDAGVKTLTMVYQKFYGRSNRIEAKVWADEPSTIAMFKAAGFKDYGEAEGGYITLIKSDFIGIDMMEQRLKESARDMARNLDFDPDLIEYSQETLEFELGGAKYKYAGSYTFGQPSVVLYMTQINANNVKGVTAHEIGHRKYDLLDKNFRAEYNGVMHEPGPPPDPNGKYYWQISGGHAAVMTPDGSLREPYDKKYPIYQEMIRIRNMNSPTLQESDGITNYSKAYWAEWNKGKVKTLTAEHETIAEMSLMYGIYGSHATQAARPWRDLYELMDKVWAAAPAEERGAKPKKAA